ncbi:MAG: isocitrate/isopropylmalate family dehydrogenase, partial [Aeromicrobium sp.]
MTREFTLAVVPGDGIGPEVTAQALAVLDLVAAEHDVNFAATEYDLGEGRVELGTHDPGPLGS